jgi:glycosidase
MSVWRDENIVKGWGVNSSICDHLAFLYGESSAAPLTQEIERLIADARKNFSTGPVRSARPGPADCMLITYGDQVSAGGEPPLQTLGKFLAGRAGGLLTAVHLLPFYPSSSDDGFSVMDYYAVDPAMGTWDDIACLGEKFSLMFDAVFNHASAQGVWFGKFLRQEPTWEEAFFTVSGSPDLTQVVRPRALPLLTEFSTSGGPRKVWTTFSADQADLNLGDPRMLIRLLEVLFFYVSHGAGYIRLDAIAFLWKVPGTRCIHLEQTHRIIQLMRAALEDFAPGVQLITETNVPHADNISYFGNGRNEAHLVYNFALPPLVFHTLRTGDAGALSRWAATLELPSDEATFFNFLASHDGIGLNPARGILESGEIDALVAAVLAHGGYVSYKNNPDGTKSPYELNISYFDALSDPRGGEPLSLQVARFLAAHAILFALRGLPAVYFHSLFGSRGDRDGAESSGIPRRINRKKLTLEELNAGLDDHGSIRQRVFSGLTSLLQARGSHPAFSPFSGQSIPDAPEGVFAIERSAPDGTRVLAIVNVTAVPRSYPVPDFCAWRPILGGCPGTSGGLELPAYGVCWLASC